MDTNVRLSVTLYRCVKVKCEGCDIHGYAVFNIYEMSRVMRKPDFRLCENKDADQLRSNCEADQRLGFRHTVSTISFLHKSEMSSF